MLYSCIDNLNSSSKLVLIVEIKRKKKEKEKELKETSSNLSYQNEIKTLIIKKLI